MGNSNGKVSIHVKPDLRDRLMAYKYQQGYSDADEALRNVCEEAGIL